MTPSRWADVARELIFSGYARFLLWRLGRRLATTLTIGSEQYALERLAPSARAEVEGFLQNQFDDAERVNAGVRRGTVNFQHPCLAYFAVRQGEKMAALFIVQLFGRRTVEDYIAIGRTWRQRGLMSTVLEHFNTCCSDLRLLRRVRINRNNAVMRSYYAQRGYTLETMEGDCFILDLAP